MSAIYLNDLDNDLVDALVKHEITKDSTRRVRVMNDLISAFQAIAPDGVFIRNYSEFGDLEVLAAHAADEWVDRFGSRADRRVVLIKMFPKAEEIIATLKPENEVPQYVDHYHGGNERTLENGGIYSSGGIYDSFIDLDQFIMASADSRAAASKALTDAFVAILKNTKVRDVIIT